MKISEANASIEKITNPITLIYGDAGAGKSRLADIAIEAAVSLSAASISGSAPAGKPSGEYTDEFNSWLSRFDVPYHMDSGGAVRHQSDPTSLIITGGAIDNMVSLTRHAMHLRGTTAFLDRPEATIAPRYQAVIADLLIYYHLSANVRWIVETDSELIIRRIAARIRRGELNAEDLSVLYVSASPFEDMNDSFVERVEYDSTGDQISEWPRGDFDTAFSDLIGKAPMLLDDRVMSRPMIEKLPPAVQSRIAEKHAARLKEAADSRLTAYIDALAEAVETLTDMLNAGSIVLSPPNIDGLDADGNSCDPMSGEAIAFGFCGGRNP